MVLDVYKAELSAGPEERQYLFVAGGSDIDALPDDVRGPLGRLRFEKTIELKSGEKRIGLDSDKALKNIQSKGYHIERLRVGFQIVFPGRLDSLAGR